MPLSWIEQEEERASREVLQEPKDICEQAGIQYSARLERGGIAETIDRVAREERIDQIIMGTRGLGGVRGLLLGSVASQVLHLVDVPVISKNHADAAYNAWLQFLPSDELAKPGLLSNGNFESSPSGSPFDWRIAPGLNALTEFVGPIHNAGERMLHISFGSGRVKFPELSQVVYLGPGRYRLEGKLQGRIAAKRGLRWQLACLTGSHRVIAETDMLIPTVISHDAFAQLRVAMEAIWSGMAMRVFPNGPSF